MNNTDYIYSDEILSRLTAMVNATKGISNQLDSMNTTLEANTALKERIAQDAKTIQGIAV